MHKISRRELVYALAADRYLERLEDGWQCEECDERQKHRTKCKVCGKAYQEKRADGTVVTYGEQADPFAEARQALDGNRR